MKACPTCGAKYAKDIDRCFVDGTPLVQNRSQGGAIPILTTSKLLLMGSGLTAIFGIGLLLVVSVLMIYLFASPGSL